MSGSLKQVRAKVIFVHRGGKNMAPLPQCFCELMNVSSDTLTKAAVIFLPYSADVAQCGERHAPSHYNWLIELVHWKQNM